MPNKESDNKTIRIGILGGSFDPVHEGHIGLARDALVQARLDRVFLIPTRLQPFKLDRTPASGEDRMEMLRLALADDPAIEPCDYELQQDSVSYTYLTLRYMQEKFGPDARLYFITGADSILILDTWMKAEELLTSYSFIAGSRPGYRDDAFLQKIADIHERFGTEIIRIENRQYDISATEIRQRLAAGASCHGLIPAPVEKYIREHGLYMDSGLPLDELNEKGMAYIREHLKKSRLEHTLRVRDEAVRLAERFGADKAKAETAAIFHDMAKNMPKEEMNRCVRTFGLDEKYIDQPNLAHSKIAAELMRRDFGVSDQDILNAVASHTTGKAGMSLLEKVVFLADAIEPGRNYPSADRIRRAAETDLDEACILMLERTIEYLKQNGADIDEDTINALSDLSSRSHKEGVNND